MTDPKKQPANNIKGKLFELLGMKTPGKAFATVRVDDPGLVKELDDHNISYAGRNKLAVTIVRLKKGGD